jgi:glutamate-ammonia-ligase adenylyltransferase
VGREPDLLPLPPLTPDDDLAGAVARSVRGGTLRDDGSWAEQRSALRRAVRRARLRIAASDVLDDLPPGEVGRHLARVARAATRAAVDLAAPEVPFAVLELGRLAGGELGYPSDLDLLFVFDGPGEPQRVEAERAAEAVRRVLQGDGPADRIYVVDLDLRPGGRAAPLVASRAHLSAHLDHRAEPWERLALARLRPLAGDVELARQVVDEVTGFVRRPLSEADVRAIRRVKARMEAERIPPGDDPQFHLKLGPGALADIELTVALLLLDHGLPDHGTAAGIRALRAAGRLTAEESGDLEAAHDVCVRARNRWALVSDRPRESLPTGPELTTLARSLGTTSPELRDEYRRRTRRARRVVEHRFYGIDG